MDYSGGIAGLTFKSDGNGHLNGDVTAVSTTLTPSSSDPSWWQKKFQQNIQRSSGAVIVTYKGQEYALVADDNFIFDDPNYSDGQLFGKQVGGKIGIIQDPFGTNGQPVFLGATTPIAGSAIRNLSLSAGGRLYGMVWNYEPNYDLFAPMTYSLFEWNAAALIQAALDGQARGQKLSIPIDRTSTGSPQVPAATPWRYDGASAGQTWAWIYGVGSYSPPGRGVVNLDAVTISYPTITTTPSQTQPVGDPAIPDNVYTRLLGITDKQVMEDIAAGKTSNWDAVKYASTVLFYDGWNFFTAGFVGRQGERVEALDNGKLSERNYYLATGIDTVASIGSFFVAGKAAGAVTKAVSSGVVNNLATGAAAGAALDLTLQGSQVGTYYLTQGETGKQITKFSIEELATSTLVGAGFGLVGSATGYLSGKYPVLNQKIVWNAPNSANPLPFKWATPKITSTTPNMIGTAADSTGGTVAADAGGSITVPNGKTLALPGQASMTTLEASEWFVNSAARIPEMLSKEVTLQEQAYQSWYLRNSLKTVSRVAMENQSSAAQLSLTDPLLSWKQTVAKYSSEYSGDALWNKVVSETSNPANNRLRAVSDRGGCFVAGTLVSTESGLVPIEKIRVGDRVLSKPEQGGELAYKPVVNAFVYDDKEVYLVDIFYEDGEIGRLVVTGNHPFWVKDMGWTSVDYLEPGHDLELRDGSTAFVYKIRKLLSTDVNDVGWTCDPHQDRGPVVDLRNNLVVSSGKDEEVYAEEMGWPSQYLKQRVFNIEIEDFHTYYVGERGVWVHNVDCANPDGISAEAKSGVSPSTAVQVLEQWQTNRLLQPYKGVIVEYEPKVSNVDAYEFQKETVGAYTDVTLVNGKESVPAWGLRYPNQDALVPGSKARNVIRFDGREATVEGLPSDTFVDAKVSLGPIYKIDPKTGEPFPFTKQARQDFIDNDLARVSQALQANPGYKLIYEFKTVDAANDALRNEHEIT